MEEMDNGGPTKNNLNKNTFILLCVCLTIVCASIVSFLIVPSIGSAVCGFIPVELVSLCCAIGQFVGTVYYVKKHKYAYGDNYEWYQIINSSMYGIQNVLRVLLVVALINICAMPVIILLVIIYSVIYVRKMFRK